MTTRWQHVHDATGLKAALAYYDQSKTPVSDKPPKGLDVTLMTFEEARRHASTLKDFLEGKTDNLTMAWNAANTLGWHLRWGIQWKAMEE